MNRQQWKSTLWYWDWFQSSTEFDWIRRKIWPDTKNYHNVFIEVCGIWWQIWYATGNNPRDLLNPRDLDSRFSGQYYSLTNSISFSRCPIVSDTHPHTFSWYPWKINKRCVILYSGQYFTIVSKMSKNNRLWWGSSICNTLLCMSKIWLYNCYICTMFLQLTL